jgi:hypothetical protein
MSFKDKRFGRLTVLRQVAPEIFECDCDCGNRLDVWRSLLASRVQLNCGMCRRLTRDGRFRGRVSIHGHVRSFTRRDGTQGRATTREFNTWASMVGRCHSHLHHAYVLYGGRGIRVCARWRERGGYGMLNFVRDMGPRPVGLTLDRINPNGHYEPGNTRWATPKMQAQNQRRFIWEHCAEPPVESIRAMERRVKDELEVYGVPMDF